MGSAMDKLMGTNTLRPQGMSYGGSPEMADAYLYRDQEAQQGGTAMVGQGLADMNEANLVYENQLGQTADQLAKQNGRANYEFSNLRANAEAQQNGANYDARGYGTGADAYLYRYDAGRSGMADTASAMRSNGMADANMLQGYAQGAAGEYQSAADAAFRAATERNQRNALGLAAGGGAAGIRSALASSTMGNAQAAVDQQAIRAQEANQLNAMRNDALTSAAGIRQQGLGNAGGMQAQLGGLDQQAAQLQAQRQQAAQQLGYGYSGMRNDLLGAQYAYGLQNAGARAGMYGQQAQMAAANAGMQTSAGQNLYGTYLNAETQQNSAQLGADMATEAQRQAYEAGQTGAAKAHAVVGMSLDPGGLVLK